MKKLKMLSALMLGLFCLGAAACSDDDKETPITPAELPSVAQTFVSQYYGSSVTVASVKKDIDHGVVEYDVRLSNRHEITFNSAGEWIDVDAPSGATVPEAIIPVNIRDYVAATYPASGVNEISKEPYGYDVELTTGQDLRFDLSGGYLGIDY